jgi:hypothetical protein
MMPYTESNTRQQARQFKATQDEDETRQKKKGTNPTQQDSKRRQDNRTKTSRTTKP